MEEKLMTLTLIVSIIVFIIDFTKEVTYKGRAKGNIMDEIISSDETHYKYTISYIVNGKTYILQQKAFSNIKLRNQEIIIKYNEKSPEKSRIKGDGFIWKFAIGLIFISLSYIFVRFFNN